QGLGSQRILPASWVPGLHVIAAQWTGSPTLAIGTHPHAPPPPPRASFPQVRMIFCAGKGMWTDDGPSSSRSSSRKTRPALPRVRGRAAAGAHAPAGVWGSVGADAHRVLDRP